MKESFIFYRSFQEAITELDNDFDKVKAYESLISLALDGEIEDFQSLPSGVRVMMKAIIPIIEKDAEKYQKRVGNAEIYRENGKKGGRPPKVKENQSGSEEKPNENQKNQSGYLGFSEETKAGGVYVDVNDNDNEKEKEIKKKEKSQQDEQVDEIIDYLNGVCGTHYRASTESTRKSIRGRLSEGYTVNDFKAVIDKKYAEWKGTEWEKYLSPDTLFRPGNFEKYMNQKVNKPLGANANIIRHDWDMGELEQALLGRAGVPPNAS